MKISSTVAYESNLKLETAVGSSAADVLPSTFKDRLATLGAGWLATGSLGQDMEGSGRSSAGGDRAWGLGLGLPPKGENAVRETD